MLLHSRARHAAGALALAGALATGAGFAGAASAATPSACQASAVNLSLLGAATSSINVANAANTPCVAEHTGNAVSALNTINADAAEATTTVAVGDRATAHARVVNLHAPTSSVTSALVGPLTSGVNSILPAVNAAVSGQVGAGGGITAALAPLHALGLNVTTTDNTSLAASTNAALPAALSAALPDLVDAGLIEAHASAICSNGVAALSGSATLTGVTVLGRAVDANDPAGKALSLDSEHLTLSQLVSVTDVLKSIKVQPALFSNVASKIGMSSRSLYDVLTDPAGLLAPINPDLPVGTTVASILSSVDAVVAPILSATSIPLPTGVLHAVITPQSVGSDGSTETSSALNIAITGLGQPLLSGDLAHASVTASAADCTGTPVPPTTPKPTTPRPTTPVASVKANVAADLNAEAVLSRYKAGEAAAVLECGGPKLRLIDVHQQGKKTFIKGVTDVSLIGKKADIYFTYGNKKVATTKVDAQGVFTATTPLPASSIRETNSSRYYAVISGKRTAALKFARRMYTTKVSSDDRRVEVSGYITAPLASGRAKVEIQRRVSCGKYVAVASTKASTAGRFTATFTEPKSSTAVIYRAQSLVPKRAGSARKFETFTLPQPLALTAG